MTYSAYMEILIRPLSATDKDRWLELWNGYLSFYKVSLANEQTELTWARLMDQTFNMYGLAAELAGNFIGITHYNFQNTTWSINGHCYLEDLFVDPEVRRSGAGRSLINRVIEIGKEHKCSRVYWNTDESNTEARILYDSFALESGKRQYRLAISNEE